MHTGRSAAAGWGVATVGVLSFVLVPFALFGPQLEGWMGQALEAATGRGAVFSWSIGLLAADVLLPVPSSAVASVAAHRLGPVAGFVAIWLGTMLGSVLGLAIGRFAGSAALERLVGPQQIARARDLMDRPSWGLILAGTRGVPVLSESCLLLAGGIAVPAARVLAICAVANAGVALCYAAVGTLTAALGAEGWGVLAATVGLPVLFAIPLAIAAGLSRSR